MPKNFNFKRLHKINDFYQENRINYDINNIIKEYHP